MSESIDNNSAILRKERNKGHFMHHLSSHPPSGLIHLETAERRFGKQKIELLLEMMGTGDALMDAVMDEIDLNGSRANDTLQYGIRHGLAQIDKDHPLPAIQELLKTVESLPDWVDRERLRRGSDAYLSIGNVWILLALGPGSLVHTYSSPSIAHILMQTGNLLHMASRRLMETGLWEVVTLLPDGLTRGADGYIHNLKVYASPSGHTHAFILFLDFHACQ